MSGGWGILMTRCLPDGRRRIELIQDSSTGEAITFGTEAAAQAVADRLASVPDVEYRAARLDTIEHGELWTAEDEEAEWRRIMRWGVWRRSFGCIPDEPPFEEWVREPDGDVLRFACEEDAAEEAQRRGSQWQPLGRTEYEARQLPPDE